MLVEDARGLAALVDDRAELAGEAGRFQRELPVVLVHVELAALRAGVRRGLRLVDRRGNSVHVENAGECQAAETGADDRDRSAHGGSSRIGDRSARGRPVAPGQVYQRSSCAVVARRRRS